MNFAVCFLVLVASLHIASAVPKSKEVRCAVCRALATELIAEVGKVGTKKRIPVGGYRLNPEGKQEVVTKPYAGSESHMTEVLEGVCSRFQDYAKGHHKETGQLEVVAIVVGGQMNPHFADYEHVQDPDLNKDLETHCHSLVEDREEEILQIFGRDPAPAAAKFVRSVCGAACVVGRDEL